MNDTPQNSADSDFSQDNIEARITAMILGEASDFECEQLLELIAQRPELKQLYQQLLQMHGMLLEVAGDDVLADDVLADELAEERDATWKLPSERREQLLNVLGGPKTSEESEKPREESSQAETSQAETGIHLADVTEWAEPASLLNGSLGRLKGLRKRVHRKLLVGVVSTSLILLIGFVLVFQSRRYRETALSSEPKSSGGIYKSAAEDFSVAEDAVSFSGESMSLEESPSNADDFGSRALDGFLGKAARSASKPVSAKDAFRNLESTLNQQGQESLYDHSKNDSNLPSAHFAADDIQIQRDHSAGWAAQPESPSRKRSVTSIGAGGAGSMSLDGAEWADRNVQADQPAQPSLVQPMDRDGELAQQREGQQRVVDQPVASMFANRGAEQQKLSPDSGITNLGVASASEWEELSRNRSGQYAEGLGNTRSGFGGGVGGPGTSGMARSGGGMAGGGMGAGGMAPGGMARGMRGSSTEVAGTGLGLPRGGSQENGSQGIDPSSTTGQQDKAATSLGLSVSDQENGNGNPGTRFTLQAGEIRSEKFLDQVYTLDSVEESGVPFDDRRPIGYPLDSFGTRAADSPALSTETESSITSVTPTVPNHNQDWAFPVQPEQSPPPSTTTYSVPDGGTVDLGGIKRRTRQIPQVPMPSRDFVEGKEYEADADGVVELQVQSETSQYRMSDVGNDSFQFGAITFNGDAKKSGKVQPTLELDTKSLATESRTNLGEPQIPRELSELNKLEESLVANTKNMAGNHLGRTVLDGKQNANGDMSLTAELSDSLSAGEQRFAKDSLARISDLNSLEGLYEGWHERKPGEPLSLGKKEESKLNEAVSELAASEKEMDLGRYKSDSLSSATERDEKADGEQLGQESEKLRRSLAPQSPPAGLNEVLTETESFSTFSLHVSDVSFKLANAALSQGQWPEASKIRIEEFVNALDYRDPLPNTDEKVACQIEQAIHPFYQQRNLMRVSMRTAATGRAALVPLRLTLLLDNSGSMERSDRNQTVLRALASLAKQLGPNDQVTLISFANKPRLVADQLKGPDAANLVQMVADLPSEGGTNYETALQLASEKAAEQFLPAAQNRIVLFTDGAVNLGDANPNRLSKMITKIRDSGIAFDAAGISAQDLNDEVLESLTREGDGRYYLLDSVESADDRFAEQIAGALRPSAKNVKVQIEFNPQRVDRYKLLGFEKHLLNKEDFRNDAVDAAEMAAAEAGVAVYQFEANPQGVGDVGYVSVRFEDLSTGRMVERRWPIPYDPNAPRVEAASPTMKTATAAAMLAAKLKGETLGEAVELKQLSQWVSSLPTDFRNEQRVQQLGNMIEQARQIRSLE